MSRGLLADKISVKKSNAHKEGVEFDLTLEQVMCLLDNAGIDSTQWSLSGYHLARYNDSGDYVFGNCRFIPSAQNYAEKKISDKARAASRRNMLICNNSISFEDRVERGSRLGKLHGGKHQDHLKLSDQELVDRYNKVMHLGTGTWGFKSKAGAVLGCSPQYVGRLLKKWFELGLLVG